MFVNSAGLISALMQEWTVISRLKNDEVACVYEMPWQTVTSSNTTREIDVDDAYDQSKYLFSIVDL